MFNLKRKVKQITTQVAQSFETPRNANEVIAEIHESFDSASEKLLNDAQRILNGNYDIDKGERLKNAGFVSAKKAVEAIKVISDKQKSKELAETIQYFQVHYPGSKFITEEMVKSICQKYGLLFAETRYYISDVPEKNLQEIEAFNLREEDMNQYKCDYYSWSQGSGMSVCKKGMTNAVYGCFKFDGWSNRFFNCEETKTVICEPTPLKICASVKDFDTKYMQIEDGYKLQLNIPDPVVLQPVKGGYLIVSKWGLEASDELLVNEINN